MRSLLRWDEPSAAAYRVLAYGDSLTAGYHGGGRFFAPYASCLESEDVLVDYVGLSGWTAEEMVRGDNSPASTVLAAATQRGSFPYDLCVILAGTNDLGRRDAPAIVDDLWRLHESAAKHLAKGTVAVGVPSSHAQRLYPAFKAKCDAVNAELQRRAKGTTTTLYVPFPVDYSDTDGLWEPDGLHMSRKGYDALGTALRPIVFDRLESLTFSEGGSE
mmetsp:Transcript_29361/g.94715  ORF Transcript_29361/g.94715 Transcript_29361/m.94715 type:complete len:217 (-) Transcript_29361:143-793(-)|eukprot:CAMPEP_0118896856 /NCGR_PEP_ID=MMETSP1166-20130328/4515_1 /TAXON_ID=1104430 /ORGANISM="Chrysoreinhardia sp, Strain CCMP3193" /LENGTH=216 /DNA_ID=CAMNT_0006835915 /DNA_START=119 /DNA_END=769 /DNA_ORIENTATION=+